MKRRHNVVVSALSELLLCVLKLPKPTSLEMFDKNMKIMVRLVKTIVCEIIVSYTRYRNNFFYYKYIMCNSLNSICK